jgi:amino acid adenylation domain-containing protein
MTLDSRRELLAQRLRQKAAPSREEHPVSPGQSALLFLNRLLPHSPAYNLAFVARVVSEVDAVALERAFQRLVDRHATLRTTYGDSKGSPIQIVHGATDLQLTQVDASGWTEEDLEARVRQAFAEPYDLARGPVFRTLLFSRSTDDHVLLFGIHHIATDGWSQGIIMEELGKLYAAYRDGRAPDLPPIGASYVDTVRRRSEALEGKKGQELWAYWQKTLGGDLPSLDLPTDFPRPTLSGLKGDSCPIRIGGDCCRELRLLARTEGVTFFTVVLAAFQILLMRYSGKEDILVGTPMAGRGETDFERVVGFFVNSVVIRGDLSGQPSFREFLHRLREATLGALSHQDFPFSSLVEKLRPARDTSRLPVFQVMFNLLSRQTLGSFADLLAGDKNSKPVEFGGMSLKPFPLEQQEGAFDLTLELVDSGIDLSGSLKYSTELFGRPTVERMAGHFASLVQSIVTDPDRCVWQIPMLGEAETRRQLLDWNDTRVDYPSDVLLHELFEAQVKRTPDAIALCFEDRKLTFRELNERANRLAHHLRRLGVGPDTLVGVCMERSLDLVVALYGVIKAGGAYVPIDPEYPEERVAFMLQDAGVPVLLTQSRLVGRLGHPHGTVICLDADIDRMAGENSGNPGVEMGPEDLAYMIYTSGSTGKPKGALNTHRGICNRLLWMQDRYSLTATDRVLLKTPFSFDVSVWEFFWPLLAGAQLVLAEPGGHRDSAYLVKLIREQQITVAHFVPSMLRILLEEKGVEGCTSLRHVICSGEALPFDLQERFFDLLSSELHNLYGPTETAVDVTSWTCKRNSERKIVPIGKPVANTQVYVLDRYLQLLPVGVPGELYIGGVQVGRGYHNRPSLTAERFIADPYGSSPEARLYRTGDLCRWLETGDLDYLGRMDFQVKVRGFRIELGEIEAALGEHPEVRRCVVVAREDAPGDRSLVAYVVWERPGSPAVGGVRDYLRSKLPDYMVPSAYVSLDEIPMSPNGKVDRRALPAPSHEAFTGLRKTVTEPRTETERQLARVWQDLLQGGQLSVTDDFFDVGGHSLAALRLAARIKDSFGVELSLNEVFTDRSIARLAARIEDRLLTEIEKLSEEEAQRQVQGTSSEQA